MNIEEKCDGLRLCEDFLYLRPKARSLENSSDESGFSNIKGSCYVSDGAKMVNTQTAYGEKRFPNHASDDGLASRINERCSKLNPETAHNE